MKHLPIILFVLLVLPLTASGQDRINACVTNRNVPSAGPYYWPPDSEVKVYLMRGMFTPEQRLTIFEAMDAWTRAAQDAGAGVKFTFAGESDGTVNCQGCLSIERREVNKNYRHYYAFFFPLNYNRDGTLFSGWIDLDFATTDPHALKGYVAHELGHGLGLSDCTTCKKKQTIMNAFPGINRDNGLVAASACDLEVVKRVYAMQRAEASQKGRAAVRIQAKAGNIFQ